MIGHGSVVESKPKNGCVHKGPKDLNTVPASVGAYKTSAPSNGLEAANPKEQLAEGAACPTKTNGLQVAAKGAKSDRKPVAPAGSGSYLVA